MWRGKKGEMKAKGARCGGANLESQHLEAEAGASLRVRDQPGPPSESLSQETNTTTKR